MKNLDTGYGILRRIVRSRDVVFLEDQIAFSEIEKSEKPQVQVFSDEPPSTSVSPPMVHDDYGGEDQEEGEADDSDAHGSDDVEQGKVNNPFKKKHLQSRREDPPGSVVLPLDTQIQSLFTDGGEPESRSTKHGQEGGGKLCKRR